MRGNLEPTNYMYCLSGKEATNAQKDLWIACHRPIGSVDRVRNTVVRTRTALDAGALASLGSPPYPGEGIRSPLQLVVSRHPPRNRLPSLMNRLVGGCNRRLVY
jgi:hypothetical protein